MSFEAFDAFGPLVHNNLDTYGYPFTIPSDPFSSNVATPNTLSRKHINL